MIDLHIHTTYSDGTATLEELLLECEKKKLEVISITDHNTMISYKELIKLRNLFTGRIIKGIEISTSYQEQKIEVLVYDFDKKKMNNFLNKYFSKEIINQKYYDLHQHILKILDANKIEYSNKFKTFYPFYLSDLYSEIKHQSYKINENIWTDYNSFLRKGLYNKESIFYFDNKQYDLPLNKIIDELKNTNGKIFLAHPFQYKENETKTFITDMYNEIKLDGIECYYTTITKEQTKYLINFAKERNLFISGGSDFHGSRKQNHDIGTGNNNLKISKDILNNWNINYI